METKMKKQRRKKKKNKPDINMDVKFTYIPSNIF